MNVTTKKSVKVWESKDSDRIIWDVTLQGDDGKEYKLKTYSAKIAEEGYKGEVRSYLNPKGDRFVRQVPFATQAAAKAPYSRDDAAIKAQWAIGQAINLASVKMDKEQITLSVIVRYAKQLYAAVAQVKGEEPSDDDIATGNKLIDGLAGDKG